MLRRCLSYNFQSFLTKTHQVSTNGVSLVQQTNYSSDVARILGSLDPKKPARKKTVEVAKVTVITPENKIKVVTMEEAQKLAKVQNSSLMKDESAKKPTYKLVPTNRLYDTDESEEIKEEDSTCDSVPDDKSKRTKDQKLLYTTSIITDHDLNIKIRTATKMLEKKHPVKFVITNSGGDKAPMVRLFYFIF